MLNIWNQNKNNVYSNEEQYQIILFYRHSIIYQTICFDALWDLTFVLDVLFTSNAVYKTENSELKKFWFGMAFIVAIIERERSEKNRIIKRSLRDTIDPFSISERL